jgi:hypothetical protein
MIRKKTTKFELSCPLIVDVHTRVLQTSIYNL